MSVYYAAGHHSLQTNFMVIWHKSLRRNCTLHCWQYKH